MNELRMERALRQGPPFTTHYVARPLPLMDSRRQHVLPTARRAAMLLVTAVLILAALAALAIAAGFMRRLPPAPSPKPTPLVGYAACEQVPSISDALSFCPGRMPAGTQSTRAFLPGMTITLNNTRWIGTLDSPWAFVIRLADHPGATMLLWLDPSAIDGDRLIPGASDTPVALLRLLKSNPNLVISGETMRTIGDGIEALSFDLDLSENAPRVDPSCALRNKTTYGRSPTTYGPSPCYSYFSNGGAPFGTAKGEPVRMYLAQIGDEGTRHILLVILDNADAADAAGWTQLVAAAERALPTLRLPARLPLGD
jgi:hypothetical protein